LKGEYALTPTVSIKEKKRKRTLDKIIYLTMIVAGDSLF